MDASSTFKLSRIRDVCNGEIDEDDSFFDLILESSTCCTMESPLDDFLIKSASPKPVSPVTPLRSTPNLKVFILGFTKRSKSAKTESYSECKQTPLRQFLKSSRVSSKCSKQDDLPVASVFLDNSLRSQMLKDSPDFQTTYDVEKKSIPKYLKLIRPFYTKAPKKVKVTLLSTPSYSPAVNLSQRRFSEEGRINSFKIVARKLVRSRSTSAAIGMPPLQRRRDDMLMEDGIQAAILHCKKSYFSSCDEQKRFSI